MYYTFETKEDVKCKTEIFFVFIAYYIQPPSRSYNNPYSGQVVMFEKYCCGDCVHKGLNVNLGMFSNWNECSYGESDWSLAIYVEVFDWLAVSGTPAPPGMDVQDF